MDIRRARPRQPGVYRPRLGTRLHLFVAAADVDAVRRDLDLDPGLPERFRGWPVRFGWDGVPGQHHVRVSTFTHCYTTTCA